MSSRRPALGRGLGALLPGASSGVAGREIRAVGPAEVAEASDAPGAEMEGGAPAQLPVDAIDPNPEQPRRRFEPAELERLGESIRRHGVLQPVVVRRAGTGRYELVVGERRWRAARAAGLETIPAVVVDVSPRARLEVALVENIQRRDLNAIELAQAFRALAEAGATQDQIGERVGLDRSSIANHLRLLELPRELQEDVELGRLSLGHGKALLAVANPQRRRGLRDRIVREGLSVRAAEELARRTRAPGGSSRERTPPDPDLAQFVDALSRHLQTRVRLQGDAARGRIEIQYFGAEDLRRLGELLLGGD